MKIYKGLNFLILGFLLILIFIGLPSIIEKTNESTFCIKCHIMKPEYLNQIKGGLHNNLKCVECHLPIDNKILFYTWKIINGAKDTIIFYIGFTPEKISASFRSKEIIQNNCIRCHYQMVSKINITERKCWFCHRKINHQLTGLIETF
ncbi:MAG: cytochrome c nitrite reductase small subunit [Thermodesulfobacterium geofontis]|uniref:Cytochrome c nitrite reductase small subunit n=1 Tax=Thermodesulfobacterium geofontis TaxID=1295609 RepID=A0A2N7PPC3_9BACT|nr:MAG: cytochrome c nitrite reductase small subunit [Thermodesulfobacterium geofontis]